MEKKRVLMVMPDGLENAGVQNVIMNIVRNLHDEYVFDAILSTNERGYHEKEFLSYGGRIYRVPKYAGECRLFVRIDPYIRWLKNYSAVKKIIKENGPYHIIHCNNDVESFYSLEIACKQRIPIRIAHTHVSRIEKGHRLRNAFNALCNYGVCHYATKLIGCSKIACESTFGKNAKFEVVKNPYNHTVYSKKQYLDYQGSNEGITLIQVGAYCDNKNQKFSIEVVSHIRKKTDKVKLVLVGFEHQENYKENLLKYVSDLDLHDNIIMLPHDANIAEWLSRSSYMLFPSQKEGFGLVLIEAQAMGVRCFASDKVPMETNCGGCVYLPLAYGADKWAELILEDYQITNGCHEEYDCSQFTAIAVCQKFRMLYEGYR